MPLALDLIAALLFGALATLCALASPRSAPARPAVAAARAVGEAVPPPHWLRRTLSSRLDRTVASGLLLTLALGAAIAGGVVLGVLAYLIRSLSATQGVDNSVAAWGFHHRYALLDPWTAPDHRPRHGPGRPRARGRGRRRRRPPHERTLGRPVPPRRVRRPGGAHVVGEGPRRARPTGLRSRGGGSRAVVPERPLRNLGGVLRRGCARARPAHATPRPRPPRRARRRDRRGRRREPRPPRLPLAVRRRRRPRARLGLVRRLRDPVRRRASSARPRGSRPQRRPPPTPSRLERPRRLRPRGS